MLEIQVADVQNEPEIRHSCHAASSRYEPRLADVLAVTEEMFGESAVAEASGDPEDPGNPLLVITVGFKGSPKESVKMRLEWHERISKIPTANSGAIRLSIVPR